MQGRCLPFVQKEKKSIPFCSECWKGPWWAKSRFLSLLGVNLKLVNTLFLSIAITQNYLYPLVNIAYHNLQMLCKCRLNYKIKHVVAPLQPFQSFQAIGMTEWNKFRRRHEHTSPRKPISLLPLPSSHVGHELPVEPGRLGHRRVGGHEVVHHVLHLSDRRPPLHPLTPLSTPATAPPRPHHEHQLSLPILAHSNKAKSTLIWRFFGPCEIELACDSCYSQHHRWTHSVDKQTQKSERRFFNFKSTTISDPTEICEISHCVIRNDD